MSPKSTSRSALANLARSERVRQALERSDGYRSSVIAWSIILAAPSMPCYSAKKFADAIDGFEDFDHPEKLQSEVKDDKLYVCHGDEHSKWRIIFPQDQLASKEWAALCSAVAKEIVEQRKVFKQRSKVKEICDTTFNMLSKELDGALMDAGSLSKHMKKCRSRKQECERLMKMVCSAIENMFNALQAAELNVDDFMCNPWKPIVWHRTIWTFAYLHRALKTNKIDKENVDANQEEAALGLYDAWLLLENASTDGGSEIHDTSTETIPW